MVSETHASFPHFWVSGLPQCAYKSVQKCELPVAFVPFFLPPPPQMEVLEPLSADIHICKKKTPGSRASCDWLTMEQAHGDAIPGFSACLLISVPNCNEKTEAPLY